jgi:two-component system, OmpR family, phosphate regulon response regulator OmpR
VLRRTQQAHRPLAETTPERIQFGRNQLDPAARTLIREGERTRLTSGEFALLWALISHPNRPLSRDHLMNLAFGRDHEANDRSVDVMVSRLRKLIEDDPRDPRWLQTIWGAGYAFVPEQGVEATASQKFASAP